MIGIIFLVSALILGAAITRRLGISLLVFEAPALSISIGLLLWTWISFLCALFLPYNLSLPLTILIAGIGSFFLWRTGSGWTRYRLPSGSGASLIWAIFSLLTVTAIGWLMWTHDLISKSGSVFSANSTWADFGLHASLINHFAVSNSISLDFPVAAGAHLTYPFLIDLLSAWLIKGGWSIHWAIFVPSLMLIAAFLQLTIAFGIRQFGRVEGVIGGLTLTLLCGSAGGIFTAISDFSASHQSLGSFLLHLPKDYTSLTQPNAQFSNLVADAILPQRSFLFGLSTFSVVMVLLTVLHQKPFPYLAAFTGLLIGLLPLAHPSTFVVLMALVVGFWVEGYVYAKKPPVIWSIVGLASLGIAGPQIVWQTMANSNGTGGHLSLGWVISPGENPFLFFSNNYGLAGLMILTISILLITYAPLRKHLVWYLPFLAVFIAGNIYSLQPFAYDNLKLFYYVYLMTFILAGYGAFWVSHRYPLSKIPILVVSIILTASGILAVTREFQHEDLFASSDDIKLAEWVKSNTLPTDVFAASDRPNQPIATLAGRSLISGYRGWLYDYNLNYPDRLQAVQAGFNGQLTRSNAYGAKYVAVASYEPPEWTVDPSSLASAYSIVYANPSWTVYRLP